ncbi:cell division cycle 5-like protein [Cryptotermes secundus]|uniref:cell division cycle 5-like protein n=1 Tax=Cryptotermes secundus TaxID=105785 RepID=UPI001454DB15|nr:cell division cycle 5-like protein [Cryptotermes secundus]
MKMSWRCCLKHVHDLPILRRERRKDKQKLKQRKENDIPMAMLQNQEPAKKRSKLVLPEPQISDQELQQVVKMGRASEAAREVATEGGHQPSDTLLADYSLIPARGTRTPHTPALTTDRILQEAQNTMALTHVDTPLKGGFNTPLHSSNFSGMTPQWEIVTTPNTVLATPFRSQRSDALHAPAGGGFRTSNLDGSRGDVAPTPIRDKLSINPEERLDVGDTPQAMHNYQRQLREQLLSGLNSLPAPRNDYEIVIPDSEEEKAPVESANNVEDQADVDTRNLAEFKAKCELEMRSRSQPVQQYLPRPVEVNMAVLRPPHTDPPLTELQKSEELIKREMITMLHYDAVYSPPVIPAETKKRGQVTSQEQHLAYLEQYPYKTYSQDQLAQAHAILQKEMEVVKQGMGHGDLSLELYTQVWEECLAQVLFLPSQNLYTRANLASKKDRLESQQKHLEQNRGHMTREAKRAAKIEKKLKILTGGYQSRAQGLIKQLHDLYEQIEQAQFELSTFDFLQRQEMAAIPQRLNSLTEDVGRATEREKTLQAKFAELQQTVEQLQH